MLEDKQRCYFGVGWEYARRKQKITKNPFKKFTYEFEQFNEGFNAYRKSEMAKYVIDININKAIPDNVLAEMEISKSGENKAENKTEKKEEEN